jgi:hypothetical protein
MPLAGGSVLDLPNAWVQLAFAGFAAQANPMAAPPPPGTFRFVATGDA